MSVASASDIGKTENCFIPVSSVIEFKGKYSISVNEGIISVTEKTSNTALAKLPTARADNSQFTNWANPSHFNKGFYYFVLSSVKYPRAKYVYSVDPEIKHIKCVLAPLRNPQFIENICVEFGLGFTTSGDQEKDISMWKGEGIITLYDLTRGPEKQDPRRIYLKDGGGSGWDGEIDYDKKEANAFCHVLGKSHSFPIFEEKT